MFYQVQLYNLIPYGYKMHHNSAPLGAVFIQFWGSSRINVGFSLYIVEYWKGKDH